MYNRLNKKDGQVFTEENLNHIENGIYENSIHEHDEYVSKEAGKILSSNDFTDDLKNKLMSLNNYDDSHLVERLNSQIVYSTLGYTKI